MSDGFSYEVVSTVLIQLEYNIVVEEFVFGIGVAVALAAAIVGISVGIALAVLLGLWFRSFGRMEQKVDGMISKFDGIDRRFDDIDRRFDDIDRRFDDMATRLDDIANDIKETNKTVIALANHHHDTEEHTTEREELE